jgi:hypothetical protein
MARVVGLYSGETLGDLRLLGVSADEDLVAVVTDRLAKRSGDKVARREPLAARAGDSLRAREDEK